MPIQAQSADGQMHEFPDNTSMDVVDRVMSDYAKQQSEGTLERVWHNLTGTGGHERYQTAPERAVRGVLGAFESGAEVTQGALTGAYGPTGQGISSDPRVFEAASLGVSVAPRAAATAARGVAGALEGSGLSADAALQERAVSTITKKLEAGGKTAQQAMDEVAKARAAGKPMTLADVGGKQTQRLAGSVYRSGGKAGEVADQFLERRDEGAYGRLSMDVAQNIHAGETALQATDALLQSRSIEAKPLWDTVRSMEGVWSPRLQEFIDDPTFRQAMAAGYKEERLEALAEGRAFNPSTLGVDLDVEGNIKLVKAPNMHVLHIGKKGLDAMVEANRDELTGRLNSMGVALDKARRAYVEEIDSLDKTGAYARARAAWGGRTESIGAVREGQAIFRRSPEEVRATFDQLSAGDKEFFKVGVADTLRQRLADVGIQADEAKQIFKSRGARDRLRPIFKSDAEYNKFADAVDAELRMFRTNVATRGGSQTAERVATDEQNAELGMRTAEMGKQALSGELIGLARNALRTWRDLGARPDPKYTERLAEILFSEQPNLAAPMRAPVFDQGTARGLEAAPRALVPGAASGLAPQPHVITLPPGET
jgi:hypothetical protein